MYGLVNQALVDLVVRTYGAAAWQRIQRAGHGCPEMFVSMDSYADAVTYDLVHAASDMLGIPSSQLLESFGEHWVLFTAEAGYGEMLAMAGNDLHTFLLNLDTLHSHVGMAFPELRPPSFEVERFDGGLMLHYRSQREGMAPMVAGLLRGLGRRFHQPIHVEQVAFRGVDDHDVFRVDYLPDAAGAAPP